MIKIKFILIFLSLLFSMIKPCLAKLDANSTSLIENEVNRISQSIRCLVCRNQTIESSNSDFAIDVKKMIKKKLLEGKNEDHIFKYLKSRYGDYILFEPPFQLNTIILWSFPFLFFFLGIIIFTLKYIKIRK